MKISKTKKMQNPNSYISYNPETLKGTVIKQGMPLCADGYHNFQGLIGFARMRNIQTEIFWNSSKGEFQPIEK